MADNKKGFVLYTDLNHTINKLPDETAGKLFKLILAYVNDEDPTPDDMLIEIAFEPIKQQLKRDLKKYESRAERSRKNGELGGRPKKNPEQPRTTQKTQEVKKEPEKPDKVNVKDNVKVIGILKKDLFKKWVDYRIEIKKPIKKASLSTVIKLFNKEDKKVLAAAINLSILNGWQGLFPEKVNINKPSSRIPDNDSDFN